MLQGTRLLAQRGLQSGIGLSEGGGKSGERKIASLMQRLADKGIDVRGLVARANNPIRFIPPHGGNPAAVTGEKNKVEIDAILKILESGCPDY